jgi:hypothetical protein
MRQVGVLCAAAHVAIRDTVGKLADDHRKARALAGFVFSFWNLISLQFFYNNKSQCLKKALAFSLETKKLYCTCFEKEQSHC